MIPTISPWHDIVFHTLACVPGKPQDASSFYDRSYEQWIQRHWPRGYSSFRGLIEGLGAASLRSRKSFLLQALPKLWDELGSFLEDRELPFERIRWADANRESLAALIRTEVDPAAVSLLRAAIAAQADVGFLEQWHTTVEPRTRAFADRFERQVSTLLLRLPGLGCVRWLLSHPLQTRGRLMDIDHEGPFICVGVADSDLGVSETHPVIQGCHEYFLSRLPPDHISVHRCATTAGTEGFGQFETAEAQALSQGRAFFAHSAWQAAYQEWLGEPAA